MSWVTNSIYIRNIYYITIETTCNKLKDLSVHMWNKLFLLDLLVWPLLVYYCEEIVSVKLYCLSIPFVVCSSGRDEDPVPACVETAGRSFHRDVGKHLQLWRCRPHCLLPCRWGRLSHSNQPGAAVPWGKNRNI